MVRMVMWYEIGVFNIKKSLARLGFAAAPCGDASIIYPKRGTKGIALPSPIKLL